MKNLKIVLKIIVLSVIALMSGSKAIELSHNSASTVVAGNSGGSEHGNGG